MGDALMAPVSFDVSGKAVLITGGGGGIGLALGRAFREAGAAVTLADLTAPTDLPKGVQFIALDVRDDAAVQALPAKLAKLDVLIQCAGIARQRNEYRVEVFKEVLETNLIGAFRVAVACKDLLAKAKGCIINVGSVYSFQASPQAPAYGASKTAIVSLTKSLAVEWCKEGIRVNAIAPGWFVTGMSKRARENPEFSKKVMERLPIGEWAQPEELAGTALFLASPAARLITGVTLPVDGGYSAT